MGNLLVILKNGHKFTITVSNVQTFYQGMVRSINKEASNNLYIDGDFWININEVAAIHPKNEDTSS